MSELTLRVLPPARRLYRTGRGSLALIERHARVYKHIWLVFVYGTLEPMFYLLSIGVALGVLIGKIHGPAGGYISYRQFVAPGLLAVSAMNGAMDDSTFLIFFRLKYAKLYDLVLATPMRPFQVALAEISWAVMRAALHALAFMVLMTCMGLIISWWALVAVPVVVLVAFALAATGAAFTTFMKSWQDFDYVLFAVLPMFLFSGTFYPVSVYPRPVAEFMQFTPLYQGVALLRDLVLGGVGPGLLWRAAYLAAMGGLGLYITARRIDKLLLV